MKGIIVILGFVLSISVYADDLKIGFTQSNSLILRSKSCDNLVKQYNNICAWKKSNDISFEIPSINNSQCIKETNGNYKVIISSCLPKLAKDHHHKKLYKSGANCWGTAMSFKDISIRPRFLWGEEMQYWQNSPVCRKLDVGEKKRAGDILNIYGPEYIFQDDDYSKGSSYWEALFPNRLTVAPVKSGYSGYHNFLHSETFITDELTFGKDSPNYDDRFGFHNMREVYGRSRDKDCQENQSLSTYNREYQNPPKSIKGSKCDYLSLAYRCESIKEYFLKQELSIQEQEIFEEVLDLLKLQDQLFPLISTYGTKYSQNEILNFLKIADSVSDQTILELKGFTGSKTEEMLLTWKYFTAEGIRKSLELAELTKPTERL